MPKLIRNRTWTLAGAAALVWLILCLIVTPVYTTVTLTFAEDPAEKSSRRFSPALVKM